MPRRYHPLGVVCLAMACGTGPEPPAAVTIVPAVDSVEAGRTTRMVARAIDAAGVVLPDRMPAWRSSVPSVAQVTAHGDSASVTGVAPGMADITATVDGVSGTGVVVVFAALQPATGTWGGSGTEGSLTVDLTLSITETSQGALSGHGSIGPAGGTKDAFSVSSGTRKGPGIYFLMTVPGYQPFTFSGVYEETRMRGYIEGSGFTHMSTTFQRTGASAAPEVDMRTKGSPTSAARSWAEARLRRR